MTGSTDGSVDAGDGNGIDGGRRRTLIRIAVAVVVLAVLSIVCAAVTYRGGWWLGDRLEGDSNAATTASVDSAGLLDATIEPDPEQKGTTAEDGIGSDKDTAVPGIRSISVPGATIVAVVEDWRDFARTGANVAAIERNRGMGDANTMSLHVIEPDLAPGGQGGLAMAYEIGEEAPNDYVGFNRRHVPSQDWSSATHLALWVNPGGSDADVVVQFRESSGEVWRYQMAAGDLPYDGLLMLPLNEDTFQRADWSAAGNESFDLAGIDQYGVYTGHVGPGVAGTLSVGAIASVIE